MARLPLVVAVIGLLVVVYATSSSSFVYSLQRQSTQSSPFSTTTTTTTSNFEHCSFCFPVLETPTTKARRSSKTSAASAITKTSTTTTAITTTTTSRADFLLSWFFSSSWAIGIGLVASAVDPEECLAASCSSSSSSSFTMADDISKNPRYIEKEVEMKYAQESDGGPRASTVLVRRLTGDSTPYQFPMRPVALQKTWPEGKPPFKPQDFFRTDNNSDDWFYEVPKFVYHIDEPAVASLTQYYRRNISPGSDILDICSSWVSHYPLEFPKTMNTISATGISSVELDANEQLTGGYIARNLNEVTKLPYPDNSFDVVTCVVSIDYMIKPIEILREVNRVLRPGGKVIISQSNRCFPTKAIAMWLRMGDIEHLELINGFLQYAGGYDLPAKAYDITAVVPDDDRRHDPMYVVEAKKKGKGRLV